MNKIVPGYNIVSLFTSLNSQFAKRIEPKARSRHGFAYTLIGVFFIVAIAATALQFIFSYLPATQATSLDSVEIAAYQPGQMVTQEITYGYVSR